MALHLLYKCNKQFRNNKENKSTNLPAAGQEEIMDSAFPLFTAIY